MPQNAHEAKKEIAGPVRKLNQHQYEYYVLAQPSVSDAEYDRLSDRLSQLEKQFPDLLLPDSPTLRVGSDLSHDFPEVKHAIPMLSLDKAYAASEITAWMDKLTAQAGVPLSFVFEEKIDGASIVLTYEKGILVRALTRGNGLVGNDVTANVRTIQSVPLRLTDPVDCTARGEIFITRMLFEKINRGMETPFATARNLAAGTLRRVKSAETAKVPLDSFIYEGFFAGPSATHVEILTKLRRLGFKVNSRVGLFARDRVAQADVARAAGWSAGGFEDVPAFLEACAAERGKLPHQIDGLVVKVNEIDARERLGYTGHHPRWALAYKFDAPQGVTRVNKIDVQVGRTGRITPVARVAPVLISGTTVSNATLHNQEYIDSLELAEGDTVAVSRRGDVIPAVERVIEKNEEGCTTWRMPKRCPSCKSALVKVGAHHFCQEPDCRDKMLGELKFFVARDQMDIENLGPETLDVLFEKKLVTRVEDIYVFNPDDLLDTPGFGEKKIRLIKEGIERSKSRPFSAVLASLGIPELGKKAAQLLIDAGFDSIDKIISLSDLKDPEPLLAIKGIGDKLSDQVIRGFQNKTLRRRIESLKTSGLSFRAAPTSRSAGEPAVFAGQIWCVTGSFDSFKPRELAMEEVKKRGGTVTSAVSSKTTHLLAGVGAGSKLSQAGKLGVTVVSEQQFIALLKG